MWTVGTIEPGAGVGLTSAQMEILAGVTRGLSNREIADLLGSSIRSVQWHLEGAYRAMGVGHRQEAVTWCLLHGFEPPERNGPAVPAS